MKRYSQLTVLATLPVFAAATLAQTPRSELAVTDANTLVKEFRELSAANPTYADSELRLNGITLNDVKTQLRMAGKSGLLNSTLEKMQQVVLGSPAPIPILAGKIVPMRNIKPSLIAPLTPGEEAGLLQLSESVGRVEILDGEGGAKLVGTAFVVNGDEVATNCHVVKEITFGTNSGLQLSNQQALRVDFGDGPNHDARKEHRLTAVAGCPTLQGLDVGVLKLNPMSEDGQASLPPKLALVLIEPADVRGMRVALIGYPGLKNARDSLYRSLSPDSYGKVLTLGAILDVVGDPNGPVQYVHHSSNSEAGNSGSPLVLLSGTSLKVIAIHNCCYDASTGLPDSSLPCSFVRGVAHQNSAIASWLLANDPILGPLLR